MRLCRTIGMATGVALLALAIAGCDSAPRTQAVATDSTPAATELPAPVLDDLDSDRLRAQAEQALREQRIHSPAGHSAVDYYLALRERSDDAANVSAALGELQPYVLIAAEQALAREDLAETQRLLALIARIDAGAPALPRLREGLRIAQEKADRAEGARAAEVARKPTAPALPVAAAPTPSTVPASTPREAIAEAPVAPSRPATPPRSEPAPAPTTARTAQIKPRALPRLISDSVPRYPPVARNRRIEGVVQVAFTIQPDGSVTDARSLTAQPAGVFEDAALAAATRWRFEATGERVSTTRTVTFRLPADSKG